MSAMPSIRLNSLLRADFVLKVANEICPPYNEEDETENSELGMKILNEFYTELDRTSISQLSSLLKNNLLTQSDRISGYYFTKPSTVYKRPNIRHFDWAIPLITVPKAFTKSVYYFNTGEELTSIILPYEHWAAEKLNASEKERRIIRDKRTILKEKLETLLASVNSTRQLFNAWPDAIKYSHHLPIPEIKIKRAQKVQNKPAVSAQDMDLTVKLATAKFKENI